MELFFFFVGKRSSTQLKHLIVRLTQRNAEETLVDSQLVFMIFLEFIFMTTLDYVAIGWGIVILLCPLERMLELNE